MNDQLSAPQALHRTRRTLWRCGVCFYLFWALQPSLTNAATRVWLNTAGGDWSVAANWSGGQVPGAADTVLINTDGTYAVTVSAGADFGSLTLGGGAGIQTLLWSNSYLAGVLTVATNGVLDFGGDGSKIFIGGSITNYGLIRWPNTGPGSVTFRTTHLQNQPGGLIDLQMDTALQQNLGAFSFHNAGTLRKSAGAGISALSSGVAFTNAGLVEVLSGKFQFPDGFTSSSTFNVATGAAIELQNGTFTFNPGHTFTGPGFYGVAGGAPVINGPIINTNFMFTAGTLTISNQLYGVLRWMGGVLAGELTVATNGVLDFGGDASKIFTGGSLTNYGLIRWPNTGPGTWLFRTAHLQNQPGGTIDLQMDGNFAQNLGTVSFHNAGTLRKSAGAGFGSIGSSIAFTNAGNIQVDMGTLDLPSGYRMTSGQLTFGIGGGADFGRIRTTDNAPLTGRLAAVLLNGFRPDTNASFTVMTFGSSSGAFADTSGLLVGSGRYFNPVYTPTSLSLLALGTNDVSFTSQPQSRTVIAGSNVLFSAVATGTPPLSYQWRFEGTPILNANASQFTVTNAQLGNVGNYDLVATSTSGSATSAVATLTVYVPPGLHESAISRTVGSGRAATFTVNASGVPAPLYEWLLNGVPISGANSSSYTVPAASSADAGLYSVVISNAAGSITNSASLALVDLKMFAGVVIDGPLNSQYRVDYTTDVNTPTTNWIVLTNIALPTRPYIYFDAASPTSLRRFYRAVPVE